MDDVFEKLAAELKHEIHDSIEQLSNSPVLINRAVGESMRHIGSILEQNSARYLQVRTEEFLVKPERICTDSNLAVVLILRSVKSTNAFSILAEATTHADGKRTFNLFAYQEDKFNLSDTKFITLKPEIGKEIIRQLNKIVISDGAILVQCIIIDEFFAVPAKEEAGLFTSDVHAIDERSVAQEPNLPKPEPKSLLPEVDTGTML